MDSLSFYRKLCRNRYLVAANGGSAFFRKSGLIPHLIIGDLDSASAISRIIGPKTTVIRHPRNKDMTDSALALEHCLKRGYKDIHIAMPSLAEIDHLLGTLLLPSLPRSGKLGNVRMRVINHRFESVYLCDNAHTFTGCSRDLLSVVPLSSPVRLSCSGTEYPAKDLSLVHGQTTALRNRIISNRARVSILGRALVIRQYSR